MANLSHFDPNLAGNPNNNIFGLPFTEEEAKVILLPVPWEVTVSSGAGTSRAADHIFKASLQVDLYDPEVKDGWKSGFYMKPIDKKVLLKSDYLRKEAELYIDYISNGNDVQANKFMCKSLKEINEGSLFLNEWVYDQTKALLEKGKLVGLIGGDHSTPLGFLKALAEQEGEFGILQIDAHCDLRSAYEDFTYSHASIMYNALKEIPQVKQLLQVGIRDYSETEVEFINGNPERIVTYFDQQIKERQFEGETWKAIVDEIVEKLPQKVYISYDVDGLDPKLCPNTGTPVAGGFEAEQINYLFKRVIASGRKLVGFDLNEVGVGDGSLDANVAARILFRLCNLMVKSSNNS
jgi:agmatinase